MDPAAAAQYLELTFGVLLLAKILASGLGGVYRAFCWFLAADLAGSLLWVANRATYYVDYRFIFVLDRLVVWVFTCWTVLALLAAVLKNYPGILHLSHRVLRVTLLIFLVIGVATAIPEYAKATSYSYEDWISRSVTLSLVMERVVCSVSVLWLIAVLSFLLWFPIEIPRNLAVFCVGFVVYFIVATGGLLAQSFWSVQLRKIASITASSAEAACLAYWFLFLSKAGEVRRSRLSLRLDRQSNERLIAQLETLNRSLVRSSRR